MSKLFKNTSSFGSHMVKSVISNESSFSTYDEISFRSEQQIISVLPGTSSEAVNRKTSDQQQLYNCFLSFIITPHPS